ncbi:hypothetical protein NL676_032141 [Syzygium grande]|nr:hypothetical protein NL676_032141 [Syzygium grande]
MSRNSEKRGEPKEKRSNSAARLTSSSQLAWGVSHSHRARRRDGRIRVPDGEMSAISAEEYGRRGPDRIWDPFLIRFEERRRQKDGDERSPFRAMNAVAPPPPLGHSSKG